MAAYPEFVECLRECDAVVLTGVDGSEDIGGGRAFNHTALYVRRERLLVVVVEEETVEGEQVVAVKGTTAKRKNRRNRKKKVSGVDVDVEDVVKGMNSIAL